MAAADRRTPRRREPDGNRDGRNRDGGRQELACSSVKGIAHSTGAALRACDPRILMAVSLFQWRSVAIQGQLSTISFSAEAVAPAVVRLNAAICVIRNSSGFRISVRQAANHSHEETKQPQPPTPRSLNYAPSAPLLHTASTRLSFAGYALGTSSLGPSALLLPLLLSSPP